MGMTSVVLIILAVSVRLVAWADAALQRRELARQAEVQDSAAETTAEPVVEPVDDQSDGRIRAAVIAVALELSKREQTQTASDRVSGTADATSGKAVYDTWLTEGRARQRDRHGNAGRVPIRR